MESNNWVKCFSVVTFDEDLGQRVEYQTPALMSEFQLQSLAFLAFPDSNSFNTVGDLFYVFKMKFDPILFGYVFFRQCRDLSRPRKFFQKSLVLLSPHPYISLFKQIVEIVGPLYFLHGESIFEAVNSCIKIWPSNTAGLTLEFPILGSIVYFTVPSKDTSSNPVVVYEGLSGMLESLNLGHPGLYQDINLYETFGAKFCKKYIWTMWEIIMSGEDLLFVTDSPGTCSLGVFALISLISPLIYSGDVYPYFTIFDNDFKIVQNNYERKKSSDTVIGATNPYILKAFADMPNVFQFEGNLGLSLVHSKTSQAQLVAKIPKLFEGATKEQQAINNTAIRKYFRDATLAFIQPFQEYLVVDQEAISKAPFAASPLKSFNETEFLGNVGNSKYIGNFCKYFSKSRAVGLYGKFVKSSTFVRWFAAQRQKASFEAQNLMRKAAIEFDVTSIFTLEIKERRSYYEKILSRLAFEESLGEDPDGINKLKLQLTLLGPCLPP